MRQGAAEPRNHSSRRIIVAFLVACILLLIIGPRIQPVASVLSPVFVPVESTVSGIADDIGATISSLTNLPALSRENQDLRHQIAILEQDEARMPLYRRENKSLTRALHFSDLNPSLDLQVARVIGRGTPGLSASVTIDAGAGEGVRMENPVLDANGFVIGKVTQVSQAESTVGLLTAGDINIPAMDSRTNAQGLVDTPAGGSPRLDDVVAGQKLHVGDLVVTSGLGNEFPLGSLIGQIVQVRGGNVQPFQVAPIRTAADLNNLEYVQVIRNFGPGITVSYARKSSGGHG